MESFTLRVSCSVLSEALTLQENPIISIHDSMNRQKLNLLFMTYIYILYYSIFT